MIPVPIRVAQQRGRKWLAPLLLLGAAAAAGQTAQTFTESVLQDFVCTSTSCPQGVHPSGNLLLASDGNFYGVSYGSYGAGDANSAGSVFKITPSGAFTTLYTFCAKGGNSCPDGAYPTGGLVQGTDGNFYGTTIGGGSGDPTGCPNFYNLYPANSCGTVFKITPAGSLTTLYNFCTGGDLCADGYLPLAGLVQGSDGNFYGSVYEGPCAQGSFGFGCGSLFKITPSGALTTIYHFTGKSDGARPSSPLVLGSDGNFYGSNSFGGISTVTFNGKSTPVHAGVLFKVTPAGGFTVLYSFCSDNTIALCQDGRAPNAITLGPDGNFYGTTGAGGMSNDGVAFQLTPAGNFTVIHNFCAPATSTCPDGAIPNDLTLASDGNFYSTAVGGGANGGGTFFRLTPSGSLTPLYAFCAPLAASCTGGSEPNDVAQGSDGNFYTTTHFGGTDTACSALGCGTVVKLTASPAEPFISAGTAANGATYIPGGLVAGSWAQVKGTDLAATARIWTGADFTGLGNGLPVNLSGTQVLVNKVPAAVYYVSPGQISFQVPSGVTGNANVQVINNSVDSNTLTAAASNSSPGIFPVIVNGVNYPAGVFLDGRYVGDPTVNPVFRNAKPGDVIQLYTTGLVATPAGVLTTPETVNGVTVTIGTTVIPADSVTLVAVGEFQVNFTVPQSFASQPAGLYPISVQVAGASSPVTINSSPPGQMVIPIQP